MRRILFCIALLSYVFLSGCDTPGLKSLELTSTLDEVQQQQVDEAATGAQAEQGTDPAKADAKASEPGAE